MVLIPQQEAELAFWRDLVKAVGEEFYYSYRCSEYFEKVKHFPSFVAQEGYGLDYGCGCISVFEPSSKNLIAIDPLWRQYADLLPEKLGLRKLHGTGDVFNLGDATLYWVACINMIDHDPNPRAVLQDIARVLKPGGKLYFEVNFEAGLAAPHYSVWDRNVVVKNFDGLLFNLDTYKVENVPQHNQQRYWAEYTRIEK